MTWYFTCPVCRQTRYLAAQCLDREATLPDGTTEGLCGGNVARYERAKLRHGVRLRYRDAASRLERSRHNISLLVHLYKLLPPQPPPRLREWARIEAGYCIDAPDTMPAGGCYSMFVDELHPDRTKPGPFCAPAQLTTQREEA